MRLLKTTSRTAIRSEKSITGTVGVSMPTPEAFMAVISRSPDILPKAIRMPARTAIGMTTAIMEGSSRRKISATVRSGTPFVTIMSSRSRSLSSSMTNVNTHIERRNGGMNSFRAYACSFLIVLP